MVNTAAVDSASWHWNGAPRFDRWATSHCFGFSREFFVTCIFGRLRHCVSCCTLPFNFSWQIKHLLKHKCFY